MFPVMQWHFYLFFNERWRGKQLKSSQVCVEEIWARLLYIWICYNRRWCWADLTVFNIYLQIMLNEVHRPHIPVIQNGYVFTSPSGSSDIAWAIVFQRRNLSLWLECERNKLSLSNEVQMWQKIQDSYCKLNFEPFCFRALSYFIVNSYTMF